LADVLGGDDLDDRTVVALAGDRAFDRAADAGDDDLLDLRGLLLRRVLCGGAAGEGEGGDGAERGAPEKAGATSDEGSHLYFSLGPSRSPTRAAISQSYANLWKGCKRDRGIRGRSVAKMRRKQPARCAAQRRFRPALPQFG